MKGLLGAVFPAQDFGKIESGLVFIFLPTSSLFSAACHRIQIKDPDSALSIVKPER